VADLVCACEEEFRSACKGPLVDELHEGKQYCVLHFPSEEKGANFKEVLRTKLREEDFNFRGVFSQVVQHNSKTMCF